MKLIQQVAPYVFLVIVLSIAAYVAFKARQNDMLNALSIEQLEAESYWAAQSGKLNNKFRREINRRAAEAAKPVQVDAEEANVLTLHANA